MAVDSAESAYASRDIWSGATIRMCTYKAVSAPLNEDQTMRSYVYLVQTLLLLGYILTLCYLNRLKGESARRKWLVFVANEPERPGLSFVANLLLLCVPALTVLQRALRTPGPITASETVCFIAFFFCLATGLLASLCLVILAKRSVLMKLRQQ